MYICTVNQGNRNSTDFLPFKIAGSVDSRFVWFLVFSMSIPSVNRFLQTQKKRRNTLQGSFRRTNVKLIGGMAFLVFSVVFPINNHSPVWFRRVTVKHEELAVRSLFFRFYRRKHPENIDFRGVFVYNWRNSYLPWASYTSIKSFRESVDKYMSFYNNERPHSILSNRTPNSYESEYFSNSKEKQEC